MMNIIDDKFNAFQSKPNPYSFGYKIDDGYGNSNYRTEEGDEYGKVKGTYGFLDSYGVYRYVDYVADENGFRANIRTNEPGTDNQNPADVYIKANEPPANVAHAAVPQAKYAHIAPVYSSRSGKHVSPAAAAYGSKSVLSRAYSIPAPAVAHPATGSYVPAVAAVETGAYLPVIPPSYAPVSHHYRTSGTAYSPAVSHYTDARRQGYVAATTAATPTVSKYSTSASPPANPYTSSPPYASSRALPSITYATEVPTAYHSSSSSSAAAV